jgi:hypothetical protein
MCLSDPFVPFFICTKLSEVQGSEDETASTLLEGTASVNSKKKRLARKRGKIRRLKQNNVWYAPSILRRDAILYILIP